MSDPDLIRTIERSSMNGLPALSTIHIEGWILRFSDGYTNRANTVNPIGEAAGKEGADTGDVVDRIIRCEELYSNAGQDTMFKLTDATVPSNLETVLEERGYLPHGPLVNVQTSKLDQVDPGSRDPGRRSTRRGGVGGRQTMEKQVVDRGLEIVADPGMTFPWLMAFARMNSLSPGTVNILSRMLHRIGHPSKFIRIVQNGRSVGCGYTVLEDEYLGLFDILVDPEMRRQGIGELIMFELMEWGRGHGAKVGYLQVVDDNEPALRLYGKLGFRTEYQYRYLKKYVENYGWKKMQ